MNWTLVLTLAIPGLMMGLLSVKGHTRGIEPYLWILLAIFASLAIARGAGQRFFAHGAAVGVAWGLINGIVAAMLFSVYVRHNPGFATAPAGGPSARTMFILLAPVIGIVTGAVLGSMCWLASRLVHAAPAIPSSPP